MCSKELLFAILLTLVSCLAHAQSKHYQFAKLDVNDGLSHNQVNDFFKDSNGFMWLATVSGLDRYDGYAVKVYRNIPGDTTSLLSDFVNNIYEGPEGKLWIHAWAGNNVYDPVTETFHRNTNALLRRYSIPEGLINSVKKDKKGNFWFIHSPLGLFCHNPAAKTTRHLAHDPKDPTTLYSNQVSQISEDSQGNYWVIHRSGVFEKIDGNNFKVIYRNTELADRYKPELLDYFVTIDADDDLWIYSLNSNHGCYYFSPANNTHFDLDNNATKAKLTSNIIKKIVQDNKGLIWIATDHGGINLVDKKNNFAVQYLLHNENDEKSIGQNSINSLYKDDEGIIWVGTYKKGVSYYHENILRFRLIKRQVSNPASLQFDDVNAFAEDEKGNLWIGTNGGGLIYYDRKKNTFKQYLNDPRDPRSISNNVIVSLYIDHEKKLWIGTYFGGLNRFDGNRFTQFRPDQENPTRSIGDYSVWEILEDSHNNLWLGTLKGGLDVYNREKNEFSHYRNGEFNSIHTDYVPALMEDSEGNMWIGTGYGIDVLEKHSGRFVHYLNDVNNSSTLSNNSVLSMLQDSRGLIWVGTHGGLNLFDRVNKTFRSFKVEDGLPHNSIMTLIEDDQHNIWMGTSNGLSKLQVTPSTTGAYSFSFKNYDEADGLQGKAFNENAALKTSRGELIFGGSTGFNIFYPEEIGLNTNKPKVIFTDFQIFNKHVAIGEEVNGRVPLSKSITLIDKITLNHADNVFSVEFTALNFFHPEKNQYQYMLEGFNRTWLTTNADQRKVTFTNLNPGNYVLKVRSANNDGIWNELPATLKIKILPPFWKSKTAFVLYVLLIVGLLLLARWLILKNERLHYRIRQEREEAQRMHELDLMKMRFFTNVSHEFRTPLTLILTPLEKILKQTPEGDQKNQFILIHKNAKRLLNMVNQLLDFRKMEVQELKFTPSEGDIVHFISELVSSFSDLSDKKNIKFSFTSTVRELETVFDQDKVEKILFNLLSNAFKFTPEHGSVSVSLDIKEGKDQKYLEIKVKDTGIGIPENKQEKIFERFFQSDLPTSMVNQGSGIGLSITKEFVRIHGGTIKVESKPDKGSCFTVVLPLKVITHYESESSLGEPIVEPAADLESHDHRLQGIHHGDKRPVLLLVEDNEDFRFYLKDNLKNDYSILEAKNGKEGAQKALSTIPDLIVSDIMMPEMNGIDLCKKVKNDPHTSHIPVILLTARTAEEQKLEGFESGANDYITKPFNFELLQSRIKNLIAQREHFQRAFQKHFDVKASDIEITSLDEKLIQSAIKLVEAHIADPEFSVEELSRELGMSRVHLYKKLLSLTGKSPIEFIRTIRLQRAAQLLEKSQLTVAEVAYQVGFNNPKYFTKYFKDQFNKLPSVYASEKKLSMS